MILICIIMAIHITLTHKYGVNAHNVIQNARPTDSKVYWSNLIGNHFHLWSNRIEQYFTARTFKKF